MFLFLALGFRPVGFGLGVVGLALSPKPQTLKPTRTEGAPLFAFRGFMPIGFIVHSSFVVIYS